MMELNKFESVDAEDKGTSERDKNETETNHLFEENPLNNELVLGIIFDHLPKWNWKSVRLVNKTWHSTLQSRWRNGMIYKIGTGVAEGGLVTSKFLEQYHPSNDPNDSMKLGRHPIRVICMRSTCCSFYLFQPDQTRFWELYGHQLKRICFHRIQIHDIALLKRLLFELTPALETFLYNDCACDEIGQLDLNTAANYIPPATLQKNLTYFNFDSAHVFGWEEDKVGRRSQFPINWIEFFAVFPNIQILHLDVNLNRKSGLMKILEAIDIIRKANHNEVLNIKDLFVGDKLLFDSDIGKYQSIFASWPVAVLDVDVSLFSTESHILFLQLFKSTLRRLTFKNGYDYMNDSLPNNILPQGLTFLHLKHQFFASLQFLAYTPNLEELRLEEDIINMLPPEEFTDLAAIPPLVNVKKLTFTKAKFAPHVEIGILMKLIPNVKTCICIVDAEGFRALCEGWPNLEHLDVEMLFRREDFFVKNLVKLKRLRSLQIRCNARMKITDKSVFEGFLKLPALTEIILPEDVAITDSGLAAVEDKLYELV